MLRRGRADQLFCWNLRREEDRENRDDKSRLFGSCFINAGFMDVCYVVCLIVIGKIGVRSCRSRKLFKNSSQLKSL